MVWDYPTNFSEGLNVTSLGSLFQYSNYVGSGWTSTAILAVIFIMTFTAGAMMSSRKALLSSSFITFVFSVYFLRLGAVNISVVFLLLVLTIIGALGSKEESNM